MKRQIRSSVFETNSSSTHSIAVPNSCGITNFISFHIGEFGWSFDQVDAADYFYTAIYVTSDTKDELEDKIERLKNILDSHNIEFELGEANYTIDHYHDDTWVSLDNGYIDHGYELKEFVNELLDDGDKLVRFLSGGLVFTGNDNCDTEEYGFAHRSEEYLEDYSWASKVTSNIKNPSYMSDHEDYEWYYKGN